MQKLAHEVYVFDEFRLDVTRGALYSGETVLKLRPKSFEVLTHLLKNQGRLVAKEELIAKIWDGTAVTDDSLVQCLTDIRRVLSDDSQQIIRTVPRRGYVFEREVVSNSDRLIVERSDEAFQIVLEETTEKLRAAKASLHSRRRKLLLIATAVLVGVIIAGFFFRKPVLAWLFKPPSIAILPIVNATGDRSLDYVSDGLHESLIMSLSRLNPSGSSMRLRVIAQNTMIMFKDKVVEPREVGIALGVDKILASRMSDVGNLRTFKFEMIDVDSGSVVWTKQYAVERIHPADLLEKQNQIPNDIAALFPINLSDDDRSILTRRYTQNPEAYELYLKGRANRLSTPSSLRESISYYQRAIALDPDFALAHWAMAVAYSSEAMIDERPSQNAGDLVRSEAETALKIDSSLIPAKNLLNMWQGNDWAWGDIARAGSAHPSYAQYLIANNRTDEAVQFLESRLSVAPHYPILNFQYCWALLSARRPDDAIAQANRILNLVPAPDRAYFGPESPWVHLYLALAYSQKGMYDEAIAEQNKALELGENSRTLRAELASILALAGQRDSATKILDDLFEAERRGEYAPSLNIAVAYCSLGDEEHALQWLERAFSEKEDRLPSIRTRRECDFLHSDPRFVDLISRMGLSK